MGTWINSDGLVVQLGPAEAVASRIGEFTGDGTFNGYHIWEYHMKFGDFAAFGTTKVQDYTVHIPAGIYIERATLFVKTAFAGATATLSVGTNRTTDNTTAISTTGLLNAVPVATLTVGATLDYIKGSTNAGGFIGTVSDATFNGVITTTVGTANFTAGEAVFRIYGRVINAHVG